MFTGIIETFARVVKVEQQGTNKLFTLECSLAPELRIDQSLAHNGVCLTVVAIDNLQYQVVAIDETLQKTNLGHWQEGTKVNVERCMPANGRFDGHIVQGHVDQTAICRSVEDQNGSWIFAFNYDVSAGNLTVEKGSVCINGVSLTVVNSKEGEFSVAIIPYTFEHTNFHALKSGDSVNLEFDIVGKYVKALMGK